MKIEFEDIEFNLKGFIVPKITRLSDAKLSRIEDEVGEIYPVFYSNIEDMGFLSVGFSKIHLLSDLEKLEIFKILRKI